MESLFSLSRLNRDPEPLCCSPSPPVQERAGERRSLFGCSHRFMESLNVHETRIPSQGLRSGTRRGYWTYAQIPEPSTAAIVAVGATILFARHRQRQ